MLTPSGAPAWDTVAQTNFHQLVAFDLDGQVLEAPIIQPAATTFTSFQGEIDMASFSETEARLLAAVLGHGELATALHLESVSRAAVL
jgi:preprotein translocase subunit SecD